MLRRYLVPVGRIGLASQVQLQSSTSARTRTYTTALRHNFQWRNLILNTGIRSLSSEPKQTVKITFADAEGDTETVDANVGDSILDVAFDHDIEIEGACGGEMACSTCHVILDQKTFDSLPEPEEEEEDMLDLALGLTNTSRLGCQVKVTEDMDGITIQLPAETANMQ